MKLTTLAIVLMSLFVSVAAFAEKVGAFNFRVEISGVDAGVVKVSAAEARTLQCPKGAGNVTYNLIDTWPVHIRVDDFKTAKTHVVTSGKKKLTLKGVRDVSLEKDKKVVTFKYGSCK